MGDTFSIVIPVYNRAGVLLRTLTSVLNQTYRPIHLILVDNASTDNSLTLMEEWAASNSTPDFKVTVTTQPRPGAAAARNRGLELVTSEYMAFFDSDDEMMPETVSRYMEAFASARKPDIVRSRLERIDAQGKLHRLSMRGGDPLVAHIHHSILLTLGFAVRTSLVRSVGGWNENTRIWDDWELGIRLLLATDRIYCIDYVSGRIHTSAESISGLQYWEKSDLYEIPIAAAQQVLAVSKRPDRERLAAMMMYRRMMLAALYAREGHPELARPLRDRVLRQMKGKRKLILKLAYFYIRHGGRGFDRVISALF